MMRSGRPNVLGQPRLLGAAVLSAATAFACGAPADDAGSPDSIRRIDITVSEGTALAFDVSADGRWLAFDLLGQLWILPDTGGAARPLTDAARDAAHDLDPTFSPDGSRIAWQGHRDGRTGIWVASSRDASAPRLLAEVDAGLDWPFLRLRPAWSPDGSRILFAEGAEVRAVDVASGEVRTRHAAPEEVFDPHWLAADSILFRTVATTSAGSIVRALAPDETLVEIARLEARAGTVAPSPDATMLAYLAPRESASSPEAVTLRVLDRRTRRTRDVAFLDEPSRERIRWSPDGESVLVSEAGDLLRLDVASGERAPVSFTARLSFDRYEPPRRAVAADTAETDPGSIRGNRGMALSPAGDELALLVGGRLWTWDFRGPLRPVADVPPSAIDLAWSGSGEAVVWSARPPGEPRALFATDLDTGRSRRLTALDVSAERPTWSRDGSRIAFVLADRVNGARLATLEPNAPSPYASRDDIELHGPLAGYLSTHNRLHTLAWLPAGSVLATGTERFPTTRVGLQGSRAPLDHLPRDVWRVVAHSDSLLLYLRANRAWLEPPAGGAERPAVLDEAVLDVTSNGAGVSILLGENGYTRLDGDGVRPLGWPRIESIRTDGDLLVRRVRLPLHPDDPEALWDIDIEGGRIAAILPAGDGATGPRPDTLDADGAFAIPGLIDAHGHVDAAGAASFLYWGVTTTLDPGSDLRRVAALESAIRTALLPGPRVIFSGPSFFPDPGWPSGPEDQTAPPDAGGVEGVRLVSGLGGSYLKLYNPGSRLGDAADLVREARSRGLRVGGHCTQMIPLLAAGGTDKHHLGRACSPRSDGVFQDDMIALLAASGVRVVPTLSLWTGPSRLADSPEYVESEGVRPFVSDSDWNWAPGSNLMIPSELAWRSEQARISAINVRRLHEAGVPIAAGVDVTEIPGAIHWEMEDLVGAGLSPRQALDAATRVAAEVAGVAEEVGTLEPGRSGDLLLLERNPLEDIRATRSIRHLVHRGRVLDREALLARSDGFGVR